MRVSKIVSVVTADGEELSVSEGRLPGKSYGEQFVIFFTRALTAAARDIRSAVTLRLLFVLPNHLSFTDFRQLRTVELAEEIASNTGTISVSLRELHKLGILEREGTGPRTAWRMSSDWGWNGSVDQYHAFRAGRLRGKKPPAGCIASRIIHIMESFGAVWVSHLGFL